MVLFNLKNLIITLGLLTCTVIIHTDNCISFHQVSIFCGMFTLIAYKMTTKAFEPDTYIVEDYKLGKKSPRTLKKIN
jgi:hypothetical protein